jgi:hypothetical protein
MPAPSLPSSSLWAPVRKARRIRRIRSKRMCARDFKKPKSRVTAVGIEPPLFFAGCRESAEWACGLHRRPSCRRFSKQMPARTPAWQAGGSLHGILRSRHCGWVGQVGNLRADWQSRSFPSCPTPPPPVCRQMGQITHGAVLAERKRRVKRMIRNVRRRSAFWKAGCRHRTVIRAPSCFVSIG